MDLTDEDLRQAICSELHRLAGDLGCEPAKVGRDAFAKLSPIGARYRRLGTWTQARDLALGAPPVDVSALDFDDEENDTAPGVPADVLAEGYYVKRVSSLIDSEGDLKQQWVIREKAHETRAQLLERLVADLPEHVPARMGAVAPPQHTEDDLLAVYPMGDPHLGMLAWAPETGESWDLDKGEAIHKAAFDELVLRGPRSARAMLIPLGDLFHADDSSNKTKRSGHALDVDGRYAKILGVGLRLIVHGVDRLLEHHAEVICDPITGNHDDHTSLVLAVALDAYYRNEPRVTVSVSPAIHRYHRFGRVLIGLTHGHTSKLTELGGVMACDRPKEWGETEHRVWLTGHRHHTRRLELAGCVVEVFRTLAPRDAWAQGEGYRAGRDMHRIVYHRDFGEVSRTVVNESYLRSRMAAA